MRVLALPTDSGACGSYRVIQPLQLLKQTTKHDTHVVDNRKDDPMAVLQALILSDILVVRQGAEVGVPMLRKEIQEYGKQLGKPFDLTSKIVIDIDDNVEKISPYSQHYKEYGQDEYYSEANKVWIHKDGMEDFVVARNRRRLKSLLDAMKKADLITVTTDKLGEYAEQYNPNIAVLPNVLDLEKWWPIDHKPNKRLRIGWAGGSSHYEDIYSIKEPLNAILRKHDVEFYSIGVHFGALFDEDIKHKVKFLPWVPYPAHSYRLMALCLDIGIIPLADTPFNPYKSSIKLLEYSAMEIPSVCANVTPYKEDFTPGINALGYQTPEQFYMGLEALILSDELRKKIGNMARKAVEANHDARKLVHKWETAYQDLLQ